MNLRLSVDTCANALNTAAINRKSAFQTELAVGLAVFLAIGGSGKHDRRTLCQVYAAAGYQCLRPVDMDYKTVNRRVNATAELFNKVAVKAWAGKLTEADMLRAIYIGLEPYELLSVADVQRYCNPPKKTVARPHATILKGPVVAANNHTGQAKVVDMFRRAADQVQKGAQHIETQHLAIMIPEAATRIELIQMAQKLLAIAETRKELLTA